MQSVPKYLLVGALTSALLLTAGFLFGRIRSMHLYQSRTPVTVTEDREETIPTVHLKGMENGRMTGTVQGTVRVLIGEEAVNLGADGSFSVPAGSFFINYVSVVIPDGMKFVASKNGKKYYSVTSGNGERISPENRVYFRTEGEAEAAGFSK